MALVWKDRVLETTTTTGTGTLTLAGAVTGYQTWAAIGDGSTAYYCVYAVDGFGNPSGVWEVGLGTYTASGTTLARTTVYANSSGTQVALDLAAGTKRVMLTAAAAHLTTIPVVNGGTGLTALGSALQVLRVNAGGTALEYGTISTGLTVGTTAIASGTSGRLLYDAAGVLGETAAVTYATTGTHVAVTQQAVGVVPLQITSHASGSTVPLFKLARGSDGVIGVRAPDEWSWRVIQNLIVGGNANSEINNDGNPRFWFYSEAGVGKFLMSPSTSTGITCASDIPLNWESGTTVSAAWDTRLRRAAAGVVAVTDANTTGNPGLCLQAKSSTTNERTRFDVTTAAVDNTDATRKYRAVLSAYDTAAREGIRLEASGSAAMLGFYGTAATVQYATTGTVTGYTGGGGTALTHSDTFTGNTGATAYTLGDVVRALKLLGVIAA